ncbi:MAG: dihydrodipicolinate synthase family protein [Propionibacteriaceae bacterium]|nr:dihydrodipicolinate synthase family protein [Propionibacteriaceae bacterium]
MSLLRGIIPPILTPMDASGAVDPASLDRLVDHLMAGGVDGVFVLGSSGQVAYLTDAEREAVTRRVVDRVAGRVPVFVGTPDLTARRVAELARRAVTWGADSVVATAPFYALSSAAEVAEHFRLVADAVDVPVVAYDVPVRVHSKLGAELLVELGREGVIAGVKDSSGDDVSFRRLLRLNAEAGSPLSISTGHEVMVDAMALAGADGVVPGLANVDPAGYRRLWDAAGSGDWATARQEQERLARLFEIAFVPVGLAGDSAGIGAFKAALALQGVIASGAMPAPLTPLSQADVAGIQAILTGVGAAPGAAA